MLFDTFVAMSTDQADVALPNHLERIQSQISSIQTECQSIESRFDRSEARDPISVLVATSDVQHPTGPSHAVSALKLSQQKPSVNTVVISLAKDMPILLDNNFPIWVEHILVYSHQ